MRLNRKVAMVRMLSTLALIAAIGVPGIGAGAQKAKDGCSLLTPAEIQALAGGAKVENGKSSADALGSIMCQYTWGTGGNVQGGRSYLNLSATELSKAFPGRSPSVLAKGLVARTRAGTPNAAVIPGIGDAALYESNDPIRVQTTAIATGHMVIVTFESSDARGKKDQVIALLKSAVGRLQQ
jgi:hypothetical protein